MEKVKIMLTKAEIKEARHKAYQEAGHNAYFGNGFEAGVKFALDALKKEHNSDRLRKSTKGVK